MWLLLQEIKWKYLLNFSIVRIKKDSKLHVEKNVRIRYSYIHIRQNSFLKFGHSSSFIKSRLIVKNNSSYIQQDFSLSQNANIKLNGKINIGRHSAVSGSSKNVLEIMTLDGSMDVGENNMIRNKKILIRFGGHLKIGDYTNINEGTEIRVDELVEIGSYNQISYECMIWDTNTHNIYPHKKRRKLTQEEFPNFGYEFERPKTKPVIIGDDCWVSREVALLKGTQIGNKCIVGFRTVLMSQSFMDNSTIVNSHETRIFKNNV